MIYQLYRGIDRRDNTESLWLLRAPSGAYQMEEMAYLGKVPRPKDIGRHVSQIKRTTFAKPDFYVFESMYGWAMHCDHKTQHLIDQWGGEQGMNWHEVFDYDPGTGKLFWKISPSKSVKIGQEAGSTREDNDGSEFKILRFNGTTKLIHHVVWEMFNGAIAPGEVIRHKNKDRTDNRIENLIKMRRGSIAHGTNIRTDNTSGVKGVGFHKRYGKWVARIYVDGRPIYLGAYDKLENAAKARRQAEIKYGFTVNGAEK